MMEGIKQEIKIFGAMYASIRGTQQLNGDIT